MTTLGLVGYSEAEMDAWPSSGPIYSSTASSFGGNLSFVFTNFGTAITTSAQLTAFHEQAPRCVTQAALWRADNNAARMAKAIEYFNCVKNIRSFTVGGDQNLKVGWAMMNIVRALAIIGRDNYDDPVMDEFLETYYQQPVGTPTGMGMDWFTGGNWFMLFWAVKLAIASYLQDAVLWANAIAFGDFRIRQVIYHGAYDGAVIKPILGSSLADRLYPATVGKPHNATPTSDHWWTAVTTAPYTAQYGSYVFEDGVDCEIIRDIAHETMTMTSACQAALIIDRCGDTVATETMDRIEAHVAWHGRRCLYYFEHAPNFEPISPPGTNGGGIGTGGPNYRYGWYTAKRLLGSGVPAVLDSLLLNANVATPPSYTGQNHQTVEKLTESTILTPIPTTHPATIASNWGKWTGTAVGARKTPATIATSWGTWTATAVGLHGQTYPATITDNWGSWTATATATHVASVQATINSNWGTWIATGIATRRTRSTISSSWGGWTATAVARREAPATAAASWGGWTATASAGRTSSATIDTNWGGWTATAYGAGYAHINSNWGSWTATGTARRTAPATIASVWGGWSAVSNAGITRFASIGTNWGSWTATAYAGGSARINSDWGGWTATGVASHESSAWIDSFWGGWTATVYGYQGATVRAATIMSDWGTWTATARGRIRRHKPGKPGNATIKVATARVVVIEGGSSTAMIDPADQTETGGP